MRPAQAVIFDMDGVLLDSEPLHFACLNRMLADDGVVVDEEENQAYIGGTQEATFQGVIQRHGLSGSLASYLAHYNAVVLEALAGPLEPAPGAVELVLSLRAADVPLALASSSDRRWIDATLRGLGLADAFPVIASGDEITRSKPAPDIFLLAAERLGVPPADCVAIEDSPNGLRAARAAGMAVVAVRTPYTAGLVLPDADVEVPSLTELTYAQLGLADQ
jgi:HAD superfamily hydrolase (TIGR01509 family)